MAERVSRTEGGASAPRPSLYPGLRPVRTLCMLSIVAHHVRWTGDVPPEPLLGISFGLNTLQVILCALVARGRREPELRPFTARRARRLLRPWLVWSGVYIAVSILQSLRYGHRWNAQLDPSMWLIGGSFHLWFLPYGFAVSLLALGAKRLFRDGRASAGVVISSAVGASLQLFNQACEAALQLPAPLGLWLDGMPALGFGVALGCALSIESPARRRNLLLSICAFALLPLAAGDVVAQPSDLWTRYAVAVPLACAGFMVPFPDVRALTWLAERNMGVYVVHILAIQLIDRLDVLEGAGDATRIVSVYGASVAMVFGIALAGRSLGRVSRAWRRQGAH